MIIDFFTSDPHYGHRNIIQHCQRPFADVDEMNRELIKRYNDRVGTNDVVLWCGDCFFCRVTVANDIMSQLNGKKLLVRGNHDRGAASMSKLGFDLVLDECIIDIDDQTVRIKHYPYAGSTPDTRYLDRRPPKIKHEMLIHGHTHSSEKMNGKQIHVGVDSWDYAPASFDEVRELVKSYHDRRAQNKHDLG